MISCRVDHTFATPKFMYDVADFLQGGNFYFVHLFWLENIEYSLKNKALCSIFVGKLNLNSHCADKQQVGLTSSEFL